MLKELQVQTIDDFRLKIEYLRNFPILLMKGQSGPRLNKSKNVDLTGQGDTTNLQSSIVNFQFGSSSFSKNLIIPEAVILSKG